MQQGQKKRFIYTFIAVKVFLSFFYSPIFQQGQKKRFIYTFIAVKVFLSFFYSPIFTVFAI
jgi:hypothetical protein